VADVSVLRSEEYDELATFMAGFPGVRPRSAIDWQSRLRTWWDLNPAYEPAFPKGWVLREDGRIAGFFGSIPLRMQLGGEETTAFAATSWRVLPEHRGKSLTLKLRQLAAHKEQLHFSTTPRDDLVPLLQKLGYQRIERGETADTQSVVLLDCEKFLRFRFGDGAIGAVGAAIGAPILDAVQSFRTKRLGVARGDEVRELSSADAAFDDLWRRTRSRFANTNVRTAAMVNWYCFAMQPVDKKLLAYFERDRLLGYMVLLLKEEPTRRLMECVDVWIDPAAGEARVLAGLVAEGAASARRGGFERVLFPHFDARTARLYGELGLLRGPAWAKREYVKGPRPLLDGLTPDRTYFVRAQGDYGL